MEQKILAVDRMVSWVKKGRSGTFNDRKTGEPRPYQIWDFRIDGDDRYFSWFEKHGTPNPVVGAKIKGMEGATSTYQKKDGSTGYSHKIKYIEYHDAGAVLPKPKLSGAAGSTNSNRDISFYVSYAKDILIAQMGVNPEDYAGATLDQLTDQVVIAGQRMCKMATGQGEPITDEIEIPTKIGLNPGDDYPDKFDESTF